jgi:hypothetical protein
MHNASFIDQGHCVIVIKHVRARSACIRRTRRQRDALPRSARQTRHERIRDSRERERETERKRVSASAVEARPPIAGYFRSVAVRPRRMFTVVP